MSAKIARENIQNFAKGLNFASVFALCDTDVDYNSILQIFFLLKNNKILRKHNILSNLAAMKEFYFSREKLGWYICFSLS
jgi:hypothetical protein